MKPRVLKKETLQKVVEATPLLLHFDPIKRWTMQNLYDLRSSWGFNLDIESL